MANHQSAEKSTRQTAKRTLANRATKSRMRTYAKKVLTAVDSGSVSQAQDALQKATSVLASIGRRGIIHKNQASRRISRLHAKVKALATAQAAA
ncbi:MAG: 30S ribosomal protein S20 [Magnetococcales bacterium]|nr:30S ribosomal protein S20 [Magnetococcales bacterium]NGZ27333.1 30S ribosomal protein S20 [Magnetococcales bacterium]